MDSSNVNPILCFVLFVFIVTIVTQSAGEKASISKREEEDRELEIQLNILNKNPIKIISTKFGDIVDCIDVYKQPTFDHPLLKDHKIQMVPSSIPEEKISKNISSYIRRGIKIDNGFRNERCPSGTVPIRRTRKEDLLNAQYLSKRINSNHTNSYTLSHMNFHFVSIEEFSEGKRYFGGAAHISVHGIELNYDQFNTAQIWIQNGPAKQLNSIEFGWMIYPALFGDTYSRLFGYWTADSYRQTGCFNVLCPGFVQVSKVLFLGAIMHPVSIYGKELWEMSSKVYRDPKTGNWWLIVLENIIGYWPKEIFTHLVENASIIRYGGIAGEKPQSPASPMGNGYLPQLQDYMKTAFMRKMKYVDEKGQIININSKSILTRRNTAFDCYNILFAGTVGGDWETSMAYGGPGGTCPLY